MGWGDDIVWGTAKVLKNTPAADGLRTITLDVGESLSSYSNPGMFCQMKESDDAKAGFYAIASAPGKGPSGSGSAEFLIKRTDSNGWLCDATESSDIIISPPMGKGFPITDKFDSFENSFPVQNILLFAAGSGISPIRAVIESESMRLPEGRSCTLYYGARDLSTMAYKDLFDSWEKLGVTVCPVLSQPEGDYTGRKGYVQDILKADGVPTPRNTGALMCGMKEMAEAVKEIMTTAGAAEDRVLTNF